jgi:hypothetical protein
MIVNELMAAFEGCETAQSIIGNQISDIGGQATWMLWDAHGPASAESVAEETLAALQAAEIQGHSVGLEVMALVRVLTRERIEPPDGLESFAGSGALLAGGEVIESSFEKLEEISPASVRVRRFARVRVGSVVFRIDETWASGSGAPGEGEIVREG